MFWRASLGVGSESSNVGCAFVALSALLWVGGAMVADQLVTAVHADHLNSSCIHLLSCLRRVVFQGNCFINQVEQEF
jgi:hypothetical protein